MNNILNLPDPYACFICGTFSSGSAKDQKWWNFNNEVACLINHTNYEEQNMCLSCFVKLIEYFKISLVDNIYFCKSFPSLFYIDFESIKNE